MQYRTLFFMTFLSFISMVILMYVMVDSYSNVFLNFNQYYMAGIMTIPMIIFELILMKPMYSNKRLNRLLFISCFVIFITLLFFIRKQVAINDTQFLKSMIPHHAAAILMCKEARLHDPEIRELCKNINKAQLDEINFMKEKLKNLSAQ